MLFMLVKCIMVLLSLALSPELRKLNPVPTHAWSPDMPLSTVSHADYHGTRAHPCNTPDALMRELCDELDFKAWA
jgi:hypothetical protein